MGGGSGSGEGEWPGCGGVGDVCVEVRVPAEGERGAHSVHGLLVHGWSGGGSPLEDPAKEDPEGEADGSGGSRL